jgi:dGTPase
MEAADAAIKSFLFAHMYRHPDVLRVREKADLVVRRLFAAFSRDPSAMPEEWAAGAGADESARAHRAADYIAGMTDRFAIAEHRRLFDDAPDLR